MNPEATLVLSWLVLAHLLADFVLQTDHMAVGKFGDGREAWRALLAHVGVVALVHAPLIVIFGVPGLLFAATTAGAHLLIDRTKIVLAKRADPTPDAEDGEGPPLDRSWTPWPATLFMLDQLAHVAVLVGLWLLLLVRAAPLREWVDLVDAIIGGTDLQLFHRAVLVVVVLTALGVANVRAGMLFVATLVRAPRPHGSEPAAGTASPARIGATIGVLERLVICALVLGGAVASIGLVIAAKTLARFKQLDDREFAEYYLLGTLASVTVAILTSLVAQHALR